MALYREGDWIVYRHHEGYSSEGKILEERPDGKYVIGSHDNDPEPSIIEQSKIIDRM